MTISRDDIDRIYKEILPRLAKDFSSGVGVGGVPSPHDIGGVHHTGELPPALGKIIRIRGTSVQIYPGSNAGLERVNDQGQADDVVLLPPVTFTINLTLTDGMKFCGWSRFLTILTGEITGGTDSSLENLSVIRSASDSSILKGLVSPTNGGWLYVNNCDIEITQNGSGDARAISAEANVSAVELWNSYMYGNAAGAGEGYGTWRDLTLTTAVVVHGGRVRGSSYPCNE